MNTIQHLLGTEKNKLPRLPTLLHICEGLDTNLREFFDDAIFDNLMKTHNIKRPYDLTKKAGIALPTFSDFMKGDTKHLRSDTVLHICEAFNITLAEFYSDPLFDDVMAE